MTWQVTFCDSEKREPSRNLTLFLFVASHFDRMNGHVRHVNLIHFVAQDWHACIATVENAYGSSHIGRDREMEASLVSRKLQ